MYVDAHPPPVLTVAAPAETSVVRQAESLPLKLEPYQIVRATVAEGGQEQVVLNLKRHRLSARTEVPLKSGQKLNLQVVANHPQIRLRIMEEAELKHLFRALHTLGQNFDILPLLKRMQKGNDRESGIFPKALQNRLSELSGLFQSEPGKISGKDLSGLLNRLGLNLEALLAGGETGEAWKSLKSALLMLIKDSQSRAKASEDAESVLERLELFQICRHRLAREGVWYLPLPFPFLEQGYLLAEKRRGGASENDDDRGKAWKMTLNLKMSFLGDLQVFLLFEKPDLRARILCDSEDKKAIISESLGQLSDSLSAVRLKSLSVATGAEDPAAYLIRRLAPGGEHFMEAEA